ncbi:MAG: hypothetical protein ICV54_04785 [Nostoc sp. C3-bin3]|nr:hypothetical protein [Nostoc sp. C3-bin3]
MGNQDMGHGEELPMLNAQCPMPNAQYPMPQVAGWLLLYRHLGMDFPADFHEIFTF